MVVYIEGNSLCTNAAEALDKDFVGLNMTFTASRSEIFGECLPKNFRQALECPIYGECSTLFLRMFELWFA